MCYRERENILSWAVDFLSCTYSKNEVRIGPSDAETSISILEEMNRGTWKSDSDQSVGNGLHTRPNLSPSVLCHKEHQHAVQWKDGDRVRVCHLTDSTGQLLVSFTQTLITHSQVAKMRTCWRLWLLPQAAQKVSREAISEC